MNKLAQHNSFPALVTMAMVFMSLGISTTAYAAKKNVQESAASALSQKDISAGSTVRVPSVCGGMVFDRNSGRMIPRPNVDLVVKHLEIINTDRGTWVRPTIRNMCPGSISGNIHVSIGDVVVTFAGLPPRTDVRLGYAVGVSAAASYTAIVDYDHRITETNERNNRCTRSTSGNCR